MSTAPVVPAAPMDPSPAPLSEAERLIDTFVAPSKTFTDIRRNASWWAPWLIMAIVSTIFVYTVSQKVGFRKVVENQIAASPKATERMDRLPADQREKTLTQQTAFYPVISYLFPVIQLIILVIIAAILFATFKFAGGADVSFKVALAIVIYASLPGLLKIVLAIISLLAGVSPDGFTFQNPVATNPGYFLRAADNPFLATLLTNFDVFLIWTLALTAIGFTCVAKIKRGTAFTVVFGWWLLFAFIGAGIAAATS